MLRMSWWFLTTSHIAAPGNKQCSLQGPRLLGSAPPSQGPFPPRPILFPSLATSGQRSPKHDLCMGGQYHQRLNSILDPGLLSFPSLLIITAL